MIETKGIVHFTISVTDPEASEKFYREVLGLETVQIIPPIGMVFMRSWQRFRHLNEKQDAGGSQSRRRILRPPRVPR